MSELKQQNPFPVHDAYGRPKGWQWRDEHGAVHPKIYPNQLLALHDLLKYIDYLNNGPKWWQRLWWPLRYGLWPHVVHWWRDGKVR